MSYGQFSRSVHSFCRFLFCRKALTGLQRSLYCIATGPPSPCNKAAFAGPGEPPGPTATRKPDDGEGGMSKFRLWCVPELIFSSVKFRDIIVTRQTSSFMMEILSDAIQGVTTPWYQLFVGTETRCCGVMNKFSRFSFLE